METVLPTAGTKHNVNAGMNEGTGSKQGDLSRQASAWLVLLDDEPDDEALRAEFMDWLATSPEHFSAWEETTHVSGLLTALGPVASKPARIRARWIESRIPGIKALASGAVAAALAWAVVPGLVLQLRADEITDTGEARIVALADGSTVHLAPDTAIAFSSDSKGRTLNLLRGEAWFDVARDKSRPFRVDAGDNDVTVLGTAFSVRRSAEETEVAVQRGKVAVSGHDAGGTGAVQLVAGQSVIVGKTGQAHRGTIRPDRVATWREGVAIVNDQPIGDMIDRLRPWYRGYIIVRGPGASTRRVSGIYDLKNPDMALEALTRAHNVTVSSVSPWLRIVTIG